MHSSLVSILICREDMLCLGIRILTYVFVKSSVFWDIAPCSPDQINRRFEATCRLLLAGFLLGLFYDPEHRGDMLPRNVRRFLNYTVL
jgi:hypothetical protein